MKKNLLSLSAAALIALCSCSDDKEESNKGGNNGDYDSLEQIVFNNELGNGDQEFEINGNYYLPKGTYLMKGWCYITQGSTLTIEEGTVIKGDKDTKAALIVEKGGKLFAEGSKNSPIVFTSEEAAGSRRPGDWGGLIICGQAPNNKTEQQIEGGPRSTHGGNDPEDNSGVLSYVRVEFAGYPFKTDQEINGITFGSVGRGTQVDHLQVSYSNDDSFEWFGGNVNCNNLIAYHGWDDDFDTDNGYSGNLQFLLSVRHPRIADTSVSNGFESDNNSNAGTENPFTSCVFSNVTIVGPMGQADDFENTSSYINGGTMNPNNGSKLGVFQAAMQVRRNSRLNCFNSVAMGFPVGLILENDKGGDTQGAATAGELNINNVVFAGMGIVGSDKNKSFKDAYTNNSGDLDETRKSFSNTYFLAQSGNKYFESLSDLKLKQPNSLKSSANFGPTTGSPLLNAADFSNSKLSSMKKVDYIGAFSSDSDTWMEGWTNFDPQNTTY